ncbi:MAG: hypothetical protein FJZ80_04360 [Bacteroidetes bacterium]|nr:hypothetical protein [Bacteroidota bacterium]
MRAIWLGFVLCIVLNASAQASYYLTGRPFGFERNNAIKEVGFRWGLNISYAGNDVAETLGLTAIAAANDSVERIMVTSYGAEWLGTFYAQVDQEETLHQRIRQALNLPADGAGSNRFILIRSLGKKRYEAFVLDASSSQTRCVARYLGKAQRKVCMKQQDSGCELPYDFPQNHIIK